MAKDKHYKKLDDAAYKEFFKQAPIKKSPTLVIPKDTKGLHHLAEIAALLITTTLNTDLVRKKRRSMSIELSTTNTIIE